MIPIGFDAHVNMFSYVGAPRRGFIPQNPGSVEIVGSCRPYLYANKLKTRLPPPAFVTETFASYGLKTDGYAWATGTNKTADNVLKRYDRPEPPCPPDDPGLVRARLALRTRFSKYLGQVPSADFAEREYENSSAGLIGEYLAGKAIKKQEFHSSFFQHNRKLREDVDSGKPFPPILVKGLYKTEINTVKKIEEGLERIFFLDNADFVDFDDELFRNQNKLMTHDIFPEFLSGYKSQGLGFHKLMSSYQNCVYIWKGDIIQFDVNIHSILQNEIHEFRKSLQLISEREEHKRRYEFVEYRSKSRFVTLPNGDVIKVRGRLVSGGRNTSPDGSLGHLIAWLRCLYTHHPTAPLNYWDLGVLGFASDDHINGNFTYQFHVTTKQRFESYAYMGLPLKPEEDKEVHVTDFWHDIKGFYALGYRPIDYRFDDHMVVVPCPVYVNKNVASALLAPSKSNVVRFQRLCSIAQNAFWHWHLYNACKDSIDLAIILGIVSKRSLRWIEKDGTVIDYPDEQTLLRLWLGLQ